MGKKKARKQKLEMAVAHIHRRFGPRSLVRGQLPTAASAPSPALSKAKGRVPHIPTGFPALDQALGIGGLPQGRVSELLGLPTSGKTTLALKFLAQAQVGGGQVGYVDQARYLDPDYAHRCGLDLSRLLVGTPYDLQEALAMTEALARGGGLAALVFDALDVFWSDAGAARFLIGTLNRLTAPLARSGTALLFLHAASQRDAPQSPVERQAAASEDSPALSALAHTASVRLQLTRERWLRRHGDIRGYEARVEVLKNRLGPAGRAVTLAIEFNGTVRGNGL
jgi:recombination protein RecA